MASSARLITSHHHLDLGVLDSALQRIYSTRSHALTHSHSFKRSRVCPVHFGVPGPGIAIISGNRLRLVAVGSVYLDYPPNYLAESST